MIPPAEHVARMASALRQLKERIRDAVAHEVGKVVADAVRGWITAALKPRREPPDRRSDGFDDHDPDHPGWDDEPDAWDREPPIEERPPEPPAPPTRWAAALSAGAVTARWLIARRLPVVPALGVAALVGVCALAGGPLVQSALAAASAATDLVRIARSEPQAAL